MDSGTIVATVSAGAAVASVIFAFLTYRKSNEERHSMIKPIFRVKNVNENHALGMITIGVKNVGYKSTKNTIQIEWVGDPDVDVKANDSWNLSNPEDEEVQITLYYRTSTETVRGHINLIYVDLLNKKYVETLNIEIINVYNDFIEKKQRRLTPLVGKYFEN